MKPLVRKILESGLVSKHTAKMMEHWGWLEEGASDLASKSLMERDTKVLLSKLAEDIGDLLEDEYKIRETRLDHNVRRSLSVRVPDGRVVDADEDYMGHLIILVGVGIGRGDVLYSSDGVVALYRVLDVDNMYIGATVVGHQLTVEDLVPR